LKEGLFGRFHSKKELGRLFLKKFRKGLGSLSKEGRLRKGLLIPLKLRPYPFLDPKKEGWEGFIPKRKGIKEGFIPQRKGNWKALG